ncbi:sialate O-acetylesterase [soil metagenome]
MKILPSLIFTVFLVAAGQTSYGEVRMPAVFGDHMVLQQDSKLPVWGWADAGEDVTVTLGDQTAKTSASGDGAWRVDLKPVKASTTGMTLTIAGKNTLKIEDVLVGEVWICSGQSNMAFSMGRAHNAAEAEAAANDPQLRLFQVGLKSSLQPEMDVAGKWVVCTPETAKRFSAVGYFFGSDLRKVLQLPVGLIGTYVGGTPAEAWTSLGGLQKDPPFKRHLDAVEKIKAGLEKANAEYKGLKAIYDEELKKWQDGPGNDYKKALNAWEADKVKARAANQPDPPMPPPVTPAPKQPVTPDGGAHTPTVLFNGMVAPLIPYAIRGVIWYQGESNAGQAVEYRTLFPRMITDWREKWDEGDFPFLFVQLANYQALQSKPSEGGIAMLREAQMKTLALPNTGMATAIDIGNGGDIHPLDKVDVGLRLALAARHLVYGEDKLVYSGPLYDSFKVEGNKVRVTFKSVGSGLTIGVPPWTPTGVPPLGTELTGFAIAGADMNWVWAKATVDGDSIVVSSDQVPAPVAVRYSWASNPIGNLYNKEGLPASSFRTDDWDGK